MSIARPERPKQPLPERSYADPVTVHHREPECSLWDAAKDRDDCGKWYHYYEIYQELLERFVGAAPKILEIGVYLGGSLRLWHDWLGDGAIVVGIDVIEERGVHDDPENNIHVRIGDQADTEFLKSVVDEFGPFDIIVDDGGHFVSQQRASFLKMFRDGLVENGIYIVEDTHTSFWSPYIDTQRTFLQSCIQLVELMHAEYPWHPEAHQFTLEGGGEKRTMEWFEANIHSIKFFDSIVAFHKKLRPAPVSPLIQEGDDAED